MPYLFGNRMPFAHGQTTRDADREVGDEAVPQPAHLRLVSGLHAWRALGDGGDAVDDGRVHRVHEPVVDLAGRTSQHDEDGDRDAEPDDRVGAFEASPYTDRT